MRTYKHLGDPADGDGALLPVALERGEHDVGAGVRSLDDEAVAEVHADVARAFGGAVEAGGGPEVAWFEVAERVDRVPV